MPLLPKSLVPALVEGIARITSDRLLLRAIPLDEIHGVAGGGTIDLSMAGGSSRQATYHEIIAIGDDVPDGRFTIGELCLHVSAAADVTDHTKEDCPYFLVPYGMILCAVGKKDACDSEARAEHAAAYAAEQQRRKANGLGTT